tara:strand:- start:764 stop:1369 length:606 start_codon:yes stop_codon:yes gene_type:complete
MEDRLYADDRAEFALSSMVTMIVILLFSSIIAGMTLMMIEKAFTESRSQSVEQSETLNSIPQVLVLELEGLNNGAITGDELYVMFKFPYASNSIADEDVRWAVMCESGDVGIWNELIYSSGNFDAATTISESSSDINALEEFDPHIYYHITISMESPGGNGECDLTTDMSATIVIAVENGRTTEIDFYIPRDGEVGMDLMV